MDKVWLNVVENLDEKDAYEEQKEGINLIKGTRLVPIRTNGCENKGKSAAQIKRNVDAEYV